MLIHDDIFNWEGWGGTLRLGSGKCRLQIYDLAKDKTGTLRYLRPYLIIVSDTAGSKLSIRSCAGHIATHVAEHFGIDPHRMLYIEHYPAQTYGLQDEHLISERYERVDFTWHADKAMQPRWREIEPPLLDQLRSLMQNAG